MFKVFVFIYIIVSTTISFAWEKKYEFSYNDEDHSISLNYTDESINKCKSAVEEWQSKSGTLSDKKDLNRRRYIIQPPCNDIVKTIVNELTSKFSNLSQADIANLFIAFTNNIPYITDQESWKKSDYIQTPFQTLYYGEGDCEDHAILLANMFKLICYDSIFLRFEDHLAVGLCENFARGKNMDSESYWESEGKKYYYCEATAGKYYTRYPWKLGQIPDEEKRKSATIEHCRTNCR